MITNSKAQTQKMAAALAKKILRAKNVRKKALAIALRGDLGSGKTTFTQGFLKALGIREPVKSPTFVLIHHHKIPQLKNPIRRTPYAISYSDIYHIDLYRLKNACEARHLELKKILKNPRAILMIEWPEIITSLLPKDAIRINFRHGEKENLRVIKIGK